MARRVFTVSLVGLVIFLALSQLPDPSWLGIREEPDVILLYGGSGLLAGLCALVALASGAALLARRLRGS